MSSEGIWTAFHNPVEAQLAPTQPLDPIRAFGSKAAEHVLRLAGVFTLYRDLHAQVIETDEIKAASLLVNYYIAESLRLSEATQDDPDLLLAEKVLQWAQDHGPVVALIELICISADQTASVTLPRRERLPPF